MDYQGLSDKDLIKYIGGGAQVGSQAFEGCQAELNRRMAVNAVAVSKKALWIASISALAAFCSATVAVTELILQHLSAAS